MNKKKVIVIGCGGRGSKYADIMKDELPEDFEIVAAAEPIADRLKYMKERHGIPSNMCFDSWEPIFEMPKFADVVIIATMDRDHYLPAMAAIEKGYNLLLEKPIAPTAKECREIQRAAEQKGVFVLVCHVLRFTRFFMAIKGIIDSGEIGEVKGIQHIEGVGNVHQSHSFVRGNWGNSDKSSCMILQKTCHDMDILAWLIGKECTEVHSFGSLSYFRRENAPKGAPEYCIEGCPDADSCPYNAVKLYLDDSKNRWFRDTATEKVNPTDDEVAAALRTTQYGKCVFKCDNNVVDHQTVNLRFGDDVYVDFAMSAFTRGGRYIRIMGTKGEINAKMSGDNIEIYNFGRKEARIYNFEGTSSGEMITGGHGGGDSGIIHALCDMLDGKRWASACDVRESCDNHMICFAAEESRLSGRAIKMSEFNEML